MSIPPEAEHLAVSQGGAIAAEQMARLGLSRHAQADLARRDLLRRVSPGAYVLSSWWRGATPWQRYALQVRAVALRVQGNPPALPALSHVSAAVTFGLPLLARPRLVHLTGPGCSGTRGVVRHHRVEALAETQIEAGLLVTPFGRTVIDCCATLPFMEAVVLADGALAQLAARDGARREDIGIAQEIRREELLDALARRAPRAEARARKSLLFADGRSGSAAESRARVLMRGMGLPEPVLQLRIVTPYGTYYPDFCFADLGILVEIDGLVKVADPYGGDSVAAVEAERLRHTRLQEAGWEIVRFTWDDLSRPADMAQRIAAAARRARRRSSAPAL